MDHKTSNFVTLCCKCWIWDYLWFWTYLYVYVYMWIKCRIIDKYINVVYDLFIIVSYFWCHISKYYRVSRSCRWCVCCFATVKRVELFTPIYIVDKLARCLICWAHGSIRLWSNGCWEIITTLWIGIPNLEEQVHTILVGIKLFLCNTIIFRAVYIFFVYLQLIY